VGDYTAAAVASIVHGLPHAVVDGNVLRVLSRLTAEPGEIRSSQTRERLRAVAQELLDVMRPGDFNQALMELGATVCLPKNPQCGACPWRSHCSAHAAGQQTQYPVKLRPKTPQQVHLHLLVIAQKRRILLWQRAQNERKMASFWELPELNQVPAATQRAHVGEFSHSITHHRYLVQVERAVLSGIVGPGLKWVPQSRLASMPLSTMARKALALAAL
jgi:A/G-specific adenine glycosylase